jgi:hypothetical protein
LLRHLDAELNRLPDRYRIPIVLCELEGKTRKEVAEHLKIPEGTLSSRLAYARRRLAQRLERHGHALSWGVLGKVLSEEVASPRVPAALVLSTTRAATGQALVAAHVAALTEGVLRSMLLSKLNLAAGLFLALGLVIGVVVGPIYHLRAVEQAGARPEAGPAAVADAEPPGKTLRGSGKIATEERKVADFTAVTTAGPLEVEIRHGDAFRVAVTADDNMVPHIKTVKDGSALRLSIDPEHQRLETKTLKVAVTMPALDSVTLGGASQTTVEGFGPNKAFRAKVGEASALKAALRAARVDLHLTGASQVKVDVPGPAEEFRAQVAEASNLAGNVRADKVDLRVTQASQVKLRGSAKDAQLTGREASDLRLTEFVVDRATVELREASSAQIQVSGHLDYSLKEASHLEYRGKPAIGKQTATDASSVSHKPSGKKEDK